MSKYLEFDEYDGPFKGTKEVHIFNKKSKDLLGSIEYYRPWKQYVFEAQEETAWSWDCLQAVVDKLKELNEISKPKGVRDES